MVTFHSSLSRPPRSCARLLHHQIPWRHICFSWGGWKLGVAEGMCQTQTRCLLLLAAAAVYRFKSLKEAWPFDGASFMWRANCMGKGLQAAVGKLQSKLTKQTEETALAYFSGVKDNCHLWAIRVSTLNTCLPLLSQTLSDGRNGVFLFDIYCYAWACQTYNHVFPVTHCFLKANLLGAKISYFMNYPKRAFFL